MVLVPHDEQVATVWTCPDHRISVAVDDEPLGTCLDIDLMDGSGCDPGVGQNVDEVTVKGKGRSVDGL